MEIERYELIYKNDKSKSHIRLLGEEFFQRNKTFGNFIYKNKKFRLLEKIETKNIKEDELKFDIIFYKIIYNKSYMFENCETLLKISEFNKEEKQNYSQIINIYEEEESLFDYINGI